MFQICSRRARGAVALADGDGLGGGKVGTGEGMIDFGKALFLQPARHVYDRIHNSSYRPHFSQSPIT
jgi:hypothetical protein